VRIRKDATAITPSSEVKRSATTGVILQNAALCSIAQRFTPERLCLYLST
jgi:hypothetical protein